ncbi:type 4a pilus biogenesis protein PilO [Paenibacillus dokdonensis]|uniref:type 4a pilus biogenesis protein PilO n=1 Tax=Paenibacillus dokdonensis TaxID=2567944 RepID=UPI0010A85A37|nr:type 4a pilus biogenesis protein PilO [Paenibacillus dokdonensis]
MFKTVSKQEKGFTLVEFLAAIVIFSIVSIVLFSYFSNAQQLVLQLKKIQDKSFAKLTDIEFQLQESNQIALMTGKKPEDYSSVKEVKMKAVVEGGYNEIHAWMNQLQAAPRLVTIDSFSFQQPYEQRNPGSILTANISFTAYYTVAKPKS